MSAIPVGRDRGQENVRQAAIDATGIKRTATPFSAATAATADPGVPPARGMYDPALDKDSCGVGFIADIKGRKSHKIVEDALTILLNLEHRGAVGADPRAGDGAGILVQIPHKFFARKCAEIGFALPRPGEYGIGVLFMPRDAERREMVRKTFHEIAEQEGLTILGWRTDIPTDNSTLGASVKPTEPVHWQVFIGQGRKKLSEDDFERRLYIMRKAISSTIYRRYERRLSTTRFRSRAAPSSTRACSSPTSSAPIIPTCTNRTSRARSRWCISASPPTPFRPGPWRTRTG